MPTKLPCGHCGTLFALTTADLVVEGGVSPCLDYRGNALTTGPWICLTCRKMLKTGRHHAPARLAIRLQPSRKPVSTPYAILLR